MVKGLKEEKKRFFNFSMNKIIITYNKNNISKSKSKNIKFVEIIQYVTSLNQRAISM